MSILGNVPRLVELKLALECIGIKDKYLLCPIPGHTCDDIELFMLAKHGNVGFKYYHHELPTSVIATLSNARAALENAELSGDDVSALAFRPVVEVRKELFYFFEPHISLPGSEDVVFQGDTPETFDTFAVVKDGIVASRAWSIRLNDSAAEIAVETKEEHRRKGYGKQVVSAWVKHQLLLGKTPMYAHRKYNLESKALAESLGATLFADVISYH